MSDTLAKVNVTIAALTAAWDKLREVKAADSGAVLHNEVMRISGLLAAAISAAITLEFALESDAKREAAAREGGAA